MGFHRLLDSETEIVHVLLRWCNNFGEFHHSSLQVMLARNACSSNANVLRAWRKRNLLFNISPVMWSPARCGRPPMSLLGACQETRFGKMCLPCRSFTMLDWSVVEHNASSRTSSITTTKCVYGFFSPQSPTYGKLCAVGVDWDPLACPHRQGAVKTGRQPCCCSGWGPVKMTFECEDAIPRRMLRSTQDVCGVATSPWLA